MKSTLRLIECVFLTELSKRLKKAEAAVRVDRLHARVLGDVFTGR